MEAPSVPRTSATRASMTIYKVLENSGQTAQRRYFYIIG